MADFFLEVGSSGDALHDRLPLAEPNYLVLASGFTVEDDAQNPRYSVLTVPLHIKGTTKNALLNNRRAIETYLNMATIGADPAGELPWVTFGAQLTGADTLVRWRIVSGMFAGGEISGIHSNWMGSADNPVSLILRVLKGAVGNEIVDDPVTVTGANPTLYRAAIPGDMPALVEATITDNSTGQVLHKLHVGSKSAESMASGDVALVKPIVGGGTAGTADTIADSYASTTLSPLWSAVGYVQPTERYLRGAYDIWARVRDWSTVLAMPTGVTATAGQGPSLVQMDMTTPPDEHTATSASATWDRSTTAGNLLVLTLHQRDAATATLPVGWTLAVTRTQGSYTVAIYYKANAASENGTVTVTFSAAVDAAIAIEEWAGIAASSPLDVTASGGTASGTTHTTGTTATTTQAHALVLTAHSTSQSSIGDFVGYTSGYKAIYYHNSSGFGVGLASRYKVVTGLGTQEATMTSSGTDTSANAIAVFKAASTAAGDLVAGSYQYRVLALDAAGNYSSPSATVSVVQPTSASGRTAQLAWGVPTGITPTQYRVFWKAQTDSWKYLDTGSANPSFFHYTETGATPDVVPLDGSEGAQIRLALSLGSGRTVVATTREVFTVHANGQWEWIKLASEQLPPMAAPLSAAQRDYRATVEVRQPTSDSTLELDALVFLPCNEAQFTATALDDLVTARTWTIGTSEGGHAYGYLTDGSDEDGQVNATGQLMAGPGDTMFAMLMEAAGAVAQVEGMSLSVTLKIWPRYSWATGST